MLWMEKTERIIAFAVALQTIELLQIRESFSEKGIWAWKILSREFNDLPKPVKGLVDVLLGDLGFLTILWVRLVCSVAAPFLNYPWIWAILLVSTILIAVRWRGTFNGGSDYMTIIVLAAVFSANEFGQAHPRWIAVSLGYVGLQTCLSYFVAGTAKLRQSEWRNGRALTGFLRSSYYGVPEWIGGQNGLLKRSGWARLGSWGILVFECLFPLSLFNPSVCLIMIGLALGFQFLNTAIFGLNRFFWAWGAAYPALYWLSQHLNEHSSFF